MKGLEEVFRDVFPVSDLNINAQIEYAGLEVGAWECDCGDYAELGGPGEICDKCGQEAVYKEKHTLRECREKGLTYSDPIRIVVRLVLFEKALTLEIPELPVARSTIKELCEFFNWPVQVGSILI